VTASASGGTLSYGVFNYSSFAPTIRDSALAGNTNSLLNDASSTLVHSTKLDGPVGSNNSWSASCLDSTDELGHALDTSCAAIADGAVDWTDVANIPGSIADGDDIAPANVIWVAKSGGDFTSVQAALNSITGTPANRYLVRIAPGIYTGTVTLKAYVDIEGSGEGVTVLRGFGSNTGPHIDNSSATLRAVGPITAEVRLLTVENDGSGYNNSTAIHTSGVLSGSLKLTHVTAAASGLTYSHGVYNSSSSPDMDNVTATAWGGSQNYGVVNSSSSPHMHNMTASAWGGSGAYAVVNMSSSPYMDNVTATAWGGTGNYGVFNQSSSPDMHNVTASASGGTLSYGVFNYSLSAPTIRDSALTGSTNSILNDTSSAQVANTMLIGPVSAGNTCFNTYDASYAAAACP